MDTTPTAYGWLTTARFTTRRWPTAKVRLESKRPWDFYRDKGFLSRTGKSQLEKSRPEAGAPRRECLDPLPV